MKLEEARQQFIETWGTLGTNWGINRSMAQIHALLLVSTDLLSTDDIMETLQISRGNANMNVRALIDWGLIERRTVRGERVEFFAAEKDIWKVAIRILKERRKRELDPLKGYLGNLKAIDDKQEHPAEYAEFARLLQDLEDFIDTADRITNKISNADKNWFFSSLMKFVIGK
jgi:DNA-binding transcriptional regulator GbsR (MarR family)